MKRERSDGENCQEYLQQRNYMGGQTSGMTKITGEELETMEGQETHEKRDDEDNSRGRRNQGGKIRDTRVNGR